MPFVKYNLDANGNVIDTYVIDKYGTLYNPIRYKGYYFDEETNMYYCKSRYYVPELYRWLTIDNPNYLDTYNINGLNLYTYCNNNPVMYVDESGYMPRWVGYLCWGLAAAAVVGTGVALMIASGGSFAVALSAAMAASCGVASSTTILTVTSFAFVVSTLGFVVEHQCLYQEMAIW